MDQHGITSENFGSNFVGLWIRGKINRDSWGHLYFDVRGEILGFSKDKRMRKRLPRMFPLIKNESKGLDVDQIPT